MNCPICDKDYGVRAELARHIWKYHWGSEDKYWPIKCRHCRQRFFMFELDGGLGEHLALHPDHAILGAMEAAFGQTAST